MFSENLAAEVIKDNIRVNTINPGLILTEGWIEPVKRSMADSGGDWQGHLQKKSPTSIRQSARSRNWRISSSSCARSAPAIRSDRLISWAAAG